VELAPSLLPALVDVGGGGTAERLPDALLAGRVRVCRQLERAVRVELLEALGEELEHHRPRGLGATGRDRDRDPAEDAQRRALLSLSKKPSSRR
jgi:hypothetical protein